LWQLIETGCSEKLPAKDETWISGGVEFDHRAIAAILQPLRALLRKALRLAIASAKIQTTPDCAHALADQRDASVNASIFRITKRGIEQKRYAKSEKRREEAAQGREGLPRLSTPAEETLPIKGEVPQRILDPILNEAAALANVPREQLVIVRAESVVWNDGSLGCPEPGMMSTQALVNGYWVVIEAGSQKYDFRVSSGGSFRLCPPGRGQPPSQPAAN